MPLAARPPAANYSGAPLAYFTSSARRSHGRRLLRLHPIKQTLCIRTLARGVRFPPVAARASNKQPFETGALTRSPPVAAPLYQADVVYKNARSGCSFYTSKRVKPRYFDEERGGAARTDGSILAVCDCLRAFVLTLYHAKQRGLDKADTLFVIGKK